MFEMHFSARPGCFGRICGKGPRKTSLRTLRLRGKNSLTAFGAKKILYQPATRLGVYIGDDFNTMI